MKVHSAGRGQWQDGGGFDRRRMPVQFGTPSRWMGRGFGAWIPWPDRETQQRRQFAQGAPINMPLERHHRAQWIPVIHPLPVIEFRVFGRIQPHPPRRRLPSAAGTRPVSDRCRSAGYRAGSGVWASDNATSRWCSQSLAHVLEANRLPPPARETWPARAIHPAGCRPGETARNVARSASPRTSAHRRCTG
jgi:hypothetical protein